MGSQVTVLFTTLALRLLSTGWFAGIPKISRNNSTCLSCQVWRVTGSRSTFGDIAKKKGHRKERRYLQKLGNNPRNLNTYDLFYKNGQKRTTNASTCGRQVGAPVGVKGQLRHDVVQNKAQSQDRGGGILRSCLNWPFKARFKARFCVCVSGLSSESRPKARWFDAKARQSCLNVYRDHALSHFGSEVKRCFLVFWTGSKLNIGLECNWSATTLSCFQ